jgi:hypothetical protein
MALYCSCVEMAKVQGFGGLVGWLGESRSEDVNCSWVGIPRRVILRSTSVLGASEFWIRWELAQQEGLPAVAFDDLTARSEQHETFLDIC